MFGIASSIRNSRRLILTSDPISFESFGRDLVGSASGMCSDCKPNIELVFLSPLENFEASSTHMNKHVTYALHDDRSGGLSSPRCNCPIPEVDAFPFFVPHKKFSLSTAPLDSPDHSSLGNPPISFPSLFFPSRSGLVVGSGCPTKLGLEVPRETRRCRQRLHFHLSDMAPVP